MKQVSVVSMVALALAGLLGAGCETLSGERRQHAQAELRSEQLEATLYRLEREVAALSSRQEHMAATVEHIHTRSETLRETHAADMKRIDDQLKQLDAARAADRENIVRTVGDRLTDALAAAEARQPAPVRTERGYEHTVKAGETLSEIAAAYSVNVRGIVEANRIENPDRLRVGQKLFIPAP